MTGHGCVADLELEKQCKKTEAAAAVQAGYQT